MSALDKTFTATLQRSEDGKPIAHWMHVLEQAGPLKHMELVDVLKAEHQLGHGHANALVAWFMARNSTLREWIQGWSRNFSLLSCAATTAS
jgi:hypothetical protein